MSEITISSLNSRITVVKKELYIQLESREEAFNFIEKLRVSIEETWPHSVRPTIISAPAHIPYRKIGIIAASYAHFKMWFERWSASDAIQNLIGQHLDPNNTIWVANEDTFRGFDRRTSCIIIVPTADRNPAMRYDLRNLSDNIFDVRNNPLFDM